MIKESILTKRELEVIRKKLQNKRLNQQDSNYLSKYVRKKLRKISEIEPEYLLKRLEYNQKAIPIEDKIKKIILKDLMDVEAIVLYGSAIQTSYERYNDIDVLVLTKTKKWNTLNEKYKIISRLEKDAKKEYLKLDIQIIEKKAFYYQYPTNISLIYQLKDHKVIYGKIKLPEKLEISKINLRMKTDWSEIVDENSEGNEIYHAIRNILLVRLLLKKTINNYLLQKELINQIGINLLNRLKENEASKIEKFVALNYLKKLVDITNKEILESKWEKIILSSH